MNPTDPGDQYKCLVRHFYGRFFDLEAISTPLIEKNLLIVQTLALLVLPGAMTSLFLFPKYGHYKWRPVLERDLATLDDKCFFLSLSMILLGFLAVFEWEALFPDRKDYLILTHLPIQTRTIFLAKTAALGAFLLVFTIAIDFCPTFLFPLGVLAKNSPFLQCIRYVVSHGISMLLGNLFIFLSAISLQGILTSILPSRLASSISRWVRFFCFILLLCGLFSFPGIASVDRLVSNNDPLTVYYPPLWFLGIYEVLLGSRDPALWNLAGRAMAALALTGALSLLTYAACYRRFLRKSIELNSRVSCNTAGVRTVANFVLDRWLIRRSGDRATFHFVGQTIFRSPRHSLYVGSFLAVGLSIAIMGLIAITYSTDPAIIPHLDKAILSVPLVLSFFLLVGMRVSFAVPADLDANWLFRLSPKQQVQNSHAGVRIFLLCVTIIPLFMFCALFYALIWNWQMIVLHVCYGVTLSLLLMELLLSRFFKVPFTCSYLPGAAQNIFLYPFYILGFICYGYAAATLEAWLLVDIRKFLYFYPLAGVLWIVLASRNYFEAGNRVRFEEQSESAPVILDLRN